MLHLLYSVMTVSIHNNRLQLQYTETIEQAWEKSVDVYIVKLCNPSLGLQDIYMYQNKTQRQFLGQYSKCGINTPTKSIWQGPYWSIMEWMGKHI
jgi:hypothetical protein